VKENLTVEFKEYATAKFQLIFSSAFVPKNRKNMPMIMAMPVRPHLTFRGTLDGFCCNLLRIPPPPPTIFLGIWRGGGGGGGGVGGEIGL